MDISFAKTGNWQEHLFYAYTFRFRDTPLFTQLEDCITGCEGIARFYDMQIIPAEGPVQRLQDRQPSYEY